MVLCVFTVISALISFGNAQKPAEARALEIFYNSTGGWDSWRNKWDFNEPICGQYGIQCSNDEVRSIVLESNSLTGTIPSEIGELTMLGLLYLQRNSLSGSIPSELTNCRRMNTLVMEHNLLNGTIPDGFELFTILDGLVLNNNRFSGLPEQIGPRNFLGLLALAENEFVGTIPRSILEFRRLWIMTIAGNKFSCPIIDIDSMSLQDSDFARLKREMNCSNYGKWRIDRMGECQYDGRYPVAEVHCYYNDTDIVDDPNCEYAPKPVYLECTPTWVASGWGDCIDGMQHRTSECRSEEDGILMDLDLCPLPAPEVVQACFTTWFTTQMIYIVSGSSVFILLLIVFACYRYRKYKKMQLSKNLIPFKELTSITIIAEGNFGIVYKAIWKSAKGSKAVAIKIPKLDPSKSDWLELTVLNNVKPHKNVLSLYGVCTDFEGVAGARIGIVVPLYIEGSLDDYLLGLGEPLSHWAKCSLAIDMAKGLQHIHKSGFVHRDVAPRNFLLSHNKTDVVISDFGLSRPISKDGKYKVVGVANLPAINAPETLTKAISTKESDIWQFGVCMWWIYAAGRENLAAFDISVVQKSERDEVPLKFHDDSQFAQIIKDCCSFDPEARLTTEKIILELTILREDVNYMMDNDGVVAGNPLLGYISPAGQGYGLTAPGNDEKDESPPGDVGIDDSKSADDSKSTGDMDMENKEVCQLPESEAPLLGVPVDNSECA